jgi:3-oxo-5-alpha-steroid 4-dehydrogenase 1
MITALELTTFNIITWIWMAMALATFILLLKIVAPFGRHTRSDFGPVINNIRAWIIMESVSLVTFCFFFFIGSGPKSWVNYVLLVCWVVHYVNRSFIYPFRQKDKKKIMPLAIMLSGIFFNLMNGFLNGYYLGNFSNAIPVEWFYDPRFLVGFFFFFWGMFINMRSDTRLLALRKPGETDYKIPYGGLFRFISCPNHFGEILEWTGFAMMAWNLPALSFAIWTFANLAPRSFAHHRWYKSHFADYPAKRKALIPFVV